MNKLFWASVLFFVVMVLAMSQSHAQTVCLSSYASIEAQAREGRADRRELDAKERLLVQNWYNSLPPITNYVLARVVIYSIPDTSRVVLMTEGDCIIEFGTATYEQIMEAARAYAQEQAQIEHDMDELSAVLREMVRRGGLAATGQ